MILHAAALAEAGRDAVHRLHADGVVGVQPQLEYIRELREVQAAAGVPVVHLEGSADDADVLRGELGHRRGVGDLHELGQGQALRPLRVLVRGLHERVEDAAVPEAGLEVLPVEHAVLALLAVAVGREGVVQVPRHGRAHLGVRRDALRRDRGEEALVRQGVGRLELLQQHPQLSGQHLLRAAAVGVRRGDGLFELPSPALLVYALSDVGLGPLHVEPYSVQRALLGLGLEVRPGLLRVWLLLGLLWRTANGVLPGHGRGHGGGGPLHGLVAIVQQGRLGARRGLDDLLAHHRPQDVADHHRLLARHPPPLLLRPVDHLAGLHADRGGLGLAHGQRLHVEEAAVHVDLGGGAPLIRVHAVLLRNPLKEAQRPAVHEVDAGVDLAVAVEHRAVLGHLHLAAVPPGAVEARGVAVEDLLEGVAALVAHLHRHGEVEGRVQVNPDLLQHGAVVEDVLLHEDHRLLQGLEEVLHVRDDLAQDEVLHQRRAEAAEEDAHPVLRRLLRQLLQTLGGRDVHAVQMLAVEDRVLHALVRLQPRDLVLDATGEGVGDALHRGEEDEAAQLRHDEPPVRDVREVLRGETGRSLVGGHLGAGQRPPGDGRHARVLPNEGQAGEEDADADRVQQLPAQDEDREDHQDLHPLHEVQNLPRAPEVLADEAGPREEEQRPQEDPRQVVDEVRGPEEADAAE
mmetsp:Transcript_59826/g.175522  ORF Transcript_59826/g.175522 Transcript_59826/m.175522 type:complete len:686 (-) Transcript_59826:1597-3654(-)